MVNRVIVKPTWADQQDAAMKYAVVFEIAAKFVEQFATAEEAAAARSWSESC